MAIKTFNKQHDKSEMTKKLFIFSFISKQKLAIKKFTFIFKEGP